MKYLSKKNIFWYFAKKLSNLNTSIIILLIIALLSILGTIIEQDQNVEYYKINYPINNKLIIQLNWQTITSIGLDHVYTTWWFLSLISLFFCSLITCTFSRQLPSLKYARNWKFINHFDNRQNIPLNPLKGLSNIIYSLNLSHYYIFHKKENIYGYQGLNGRIAPIFVHLSIIITLTGSILGSFSGFMAQQMIPKGEIFHIQNIIKSGIASQLSQNIICKVNNFYIEYNPNHSIKQFYSDISLLDETNKHLTRKIIYVNSPLKFHGLTFYQTDWQINGLRIEINKEKTIQEKLQKTKIKNSSIWFYKLPISNNEYINFIVTGLKEKILLYNSSNELIKSININEVIKLNNQDIKIQEIMVSTGLQIKMDPGIPIVYIGFLILMISIGISYLSYSQIWIHKSKHIFYITGTTNRAKLTFEENLIQIQNKYKEFI